MTTRGGWSEALHPRRPDGEFTNSGSGWVGRVASRLPAAHHPAVGRDLSGEVNWADVAARYPLPGFGGSGVGSSNHRLEHAADLQGFSGKPRVTDKAGVDAAVAAGGTEVYRGVTDEAHAREFTDGRYYAGTGIFGDGIYTSTSPDRATEYLRGRSGGRVMRMALAPDTKTISLRDLEAEMDDDPLGAALGDPGVYAAAKGYDAYYKKRTGEVYWVVLNRTALTVQDGVQ